jgi:hypothetical protein
LVQFGLLMLVNTSGWDLFRNLTLLFGQETVGILPPYDRQNDPAYFRSSEFTGFFLGHEENVPTDALQIG